MNHSRLGRAAALSTVLLLTAAPAVAQSVDHAIVTVIHAVPAADGFPADVYLDGSLAIDGFSFLMMTAAFELPPGEVTLDIYPQDAFPGVDEPALSEPVFLESGVSYTLVASIVGGVPVLSVYENDTSLLNAGQARLVIRQTSVNPALDILLDGEPIVSGLEVTSAASIDTASGPHDLTFVAGELEAEQSIVLGAGQTNIFYAVGSLEDGSFNLVSQTLMAQMENPVGVPTGTGGFDASGPSWPAIVVAVSLVGLFAPPVLRRGLRR